MEQAEEITRIAGKLDGVEDKLRDLLNNSRHSIDNSQAALDTVKRGEGKKQQIQVRANTVCWNHHFCRLVRQ